MVSLMVQLDRSITQPGTIRYSAIVAWARRQLAELSGSAIEFAELAEMVLTLHVTVIATSSIRGRSSGLESTK